MRLLRRPLGLVVLLSMPAFGQMPGQAPDSTPDSAPAQAPDSAPDSAPAQAPSQAPLPPPGEMARCKQLIDAGLYTAARMRLEPIVEQHPAWARAISLLGLSYYKEERFAAAVPLLARALEVDPGEIAARPYLGWSLYQLGRLEEAEATFAALRESKPDFAPASYALGLIHLDRDEIEAARASFEATIDLSQRHDDPPMEGRARARLGDLHLRLGELETAKAQLERAIELMPDEYEALFTLSRVLQRLGDDEGAAQARRRFEEAKARAPSRSTPG